MTCRHCGQPVQRCDRGDRCPFFDCRGWIHGRSHQHTCERSDPLAFDESAEPEPGGLPTVESPAGRPEGEVA